MKFPSYFRPVFFTAFFLFSRTAASQVVSFEITTPDKKPRLAEPFKLRVKASYGGDYALKVDTASIDAESFEILKISEFPPKKSGGATAAEFEFEAAAFAIGTSTFPEITFRLTGADGAAEAKTPPLKLEIEPLFEKAKAGEDSAIKDIYPPLKFIPWFWIILTLLVLCALGAFLYTRLRKTVAAQADEAEKDTRTPYMRALDSLEALAGRGLWEEGKIKEFYIELSGILRLYLTEQFSIDALLMTTSGLSRELKKTGAGVQALIKSRELLERSDLVKFAKFRPQQKDSDLAAMRQLIGEFDKQMRETAGTGAAGAAPEQEKITDGETER